MALGKLKIFLSIVLLGSFLFTTLTLAESREIRLIGAHFFHPSKIYLYQKDAFRECDPNSQDCTDVSELELEFIRPAGCRDDRVTLKVEAKSGEKWDTVTETTIDIRSYAPEAHIRIPLVENGQKNEKNWSEYVFPESTRTLLHDNHFRIGVHCENTGLSQGGGGALTIVSPGSNTTEFFMRLDGVDAQKELQALVICAKNDYALGVKVAFRPISDSLILALIDPVTRSVISDSGIISGTKGVFIFPDVAQRYIDTTDRLDLVVFHDTDLFGGDIERLLEDNEHYTRISLRPSQCANSSADEESPSYPNQNSSPINDDGSNNLPKDEMSSPICSEVSQSSQFPYQASCRTGIAPYFCFNFSPIPPGASGKGNYDRLLSLLKNPAGWGAWWDNSNCEPGTSETDPQPFWLEPRKSVFYDAFEQDTFAVSCKTDCGTKDLAIHAISPSSPLIYIHSKNLAQHRIILKAQKDTTLHFTDPFLPTHTSSQASWETLSGFDRNTFSLLDDLSKTRKGIDSILRNMFVKHLFYEFKVANDHFSHPEEGYVVRYEDIESFLKNTLLEKIGLTQDQKDDYIADILPRLGKSNFYFIGILDKDEWDNTVSLKVEPAVQKIQRFMLYFEPRETFSTPPAPDISSLRFETAAYDSSVLELGGYVQK